MSSGVAESETVAFEVFGSDSEEDASRATAGEDASVLAAELDRSEPALVLSAVIRMSPAVLEFAT